MDVERRTWPGINKPGGTARITGKYTSEKRNSNRQALYSLARSLGLRRFGRVDFGREGMDDCLSGSLCFGVQMRS